MCPCPPCAPWARRTDRSHDDAAPQLHLHRRRRPGLRRPRLLRGPRRALGAGLAGAGPHGGGRPEVQPGLQQFTGLLANALRLDDSALPVPPARRRRGADQQQEPRQPHAGPAARASDPALAAAGRRLPHGPDRQVAPGLSAALRAAQVGLRGKLRSARRRRRLLHPLRLARRARPLAGRCAPRRGRLSDRPAVAPRGRLGRAHGRAGRALLPQPALHRATLALGDARRRGARAHHPRQPVRPGGRQHPRLPPHDPPYGRGHRLDPRGTGAHRPGRQHPGGLHQRQRRRALLRQLAAGGRQDGPDRRRHPRALDRPLAGRDPRRRRKPPVVHDDGLVGNDAGRGRRGRAPRLPARRRLAAAGAAQRRAPVHAPAPLAHEPPRPARPAPGRLEIPQGRRTRIPVQHPAGRARARQPGRARPGTPAGHARRLAGMERRHAADPG